MGQSDTQFVEGSTHCHIPRPPFLSPPCPQVGTVSCTGQASPPLCCQATCVSWPCQSADNQLPAAFSSFKIQLNISGHSVTTVWAPHSGASPGVALGSHKRKAPLSWEDCAHSACEGGSTVRSGPLFRLGSCPAQFQTSGCKRSGSTFNHIHMGPCA